MMPNINEDDICIPNDAYLEALMVLLVSKNESLRCCLYFNYQGTGQEPINNNIV